MMLRAARLGSWAATLTIGQPAPSDHSACNGDSGFQLYPVRARASAATLCGIPEDTLSILENKSFAQMAVDGERNLYVPDVFNHRVLRYDSPFTTDTIADAVWGQPDFASNACGAPTAGSLCFASHRGYGAGVAFDAQGNLWVADGGNNRILRFPRDVVAGSIATTADLVLGQAGFTTFGSGSALDRMSSPAALGFGPTGRLYVADSSNFRVLVFDPPFVNGMAAAGTFGGTLARPLGLEVAPGGDGLWIFEHDGSRLRLWGLDGTVRATLSTGNPGGGSIGIDRGGNVLAAVYVYGQDVLRFTRYGSSYAQDRRLFTPPYIYNRAGPRGLRSGLGVEVTAGQLIVADGGRILFWNDPAHLANGQAADGVVAAPDAYTVSYQPECCGRIRADAGGHLWVLAGFATPEIRVYQLPLVNGAPPSLVLRMPFPVLGGGWVSSTAAYQAFAGIAPLGAGEAVWVSHPSTNRVFRIRDPLTEPVVDAILGQQSPAGILCNRGGIPPPNTGTPLRAAADMLCVPGAVTLDRLGNLFVSDHHLEVEGNWRLLEFDAGLLPSGVATPILGVPASKTFPYDGARAVTFEPAFDSMNRMVVGYNAYLAGRFVGVYSDPLGPSTLPDAYLADYASMPYSAVFDADDNLYVGDLNRSRVLVYRRPLDTGADLR